ncbi:MAG: biotin-dependent carboxyltransferase family protein [Synergistaceae bacterium]|nr:biotin-dependent carboxyltransferase family protein [Synergistaceae bacterium]
MKLLIKAPCHLTSFKYICRLGYKSILIPVSGAMDAPALIRGNILLGNPDNAAALEMTMTGPTVLFKEGNGAIAITGADLQPKLNGQKISNWTVINVKAGDVLTWGGPCGSGLRAYLCVSGGIDVPVVMGSRSTYMKAGIGGLEGRKLAQNDELSTGQQGGFNAGVSCPENLRPDYSADKPLRTVLGPQDDYIKPEGIKTFFSTEYKISPSSDRMGTRLQSDSIIEHVKGPDIVSDAIPMGAVQIPGQGVPIVMMADRQTTGGYVKIGVVHALDVARLSQFLPGSAVRFSEITQEQGIEISKTEARALNSLRDYVKNFSVQTPQVPAQTTAKISQAQSGAMNITVNGEKFFVTWERL